MSKPMPLPPSVASHRLEVFSLDQFLDDLMERVGHRPLDLGDDATRQRFRAWLRENFDHLLLELRWAAQKGAERGIEQVLTLAADPDYYETRKKRRRQRRTRERFEQERSQQEWMLEREAREAETRQLIQEGKLRSITGWRPRDITPKQERKDED